VVGHVHYVPSPRSDSPAPFQVANGRDNQCAVRYRLPINGDAAVVRARDHRRTRPARRGFRAAMRPLRLSRQRRLTCSLRPRARRQAVVTPRRARPWKSSKREVNVMEARLPHRTLSSREVGAVERNRTPLEARRVGRQPLGDIHDVPAPCRDSSAPFNFTDGGHNHRAVRRTLSVDGDAAVVRPWDHRWAGLLCHAHTFSCSVRTTGVPSGRVTTP